jgi:hypothetical protein
MTAPSAKSHCPPGCCPTQTVSSPWREAAQAEAVPDDEDRGQGQVYRCDLGYGLKPWLVVSNDSRNRLLDEVIAIRLTTTARDLPTWVKLSPPIR